MKVIENVTIYRCEYCNKASVSKGAMTLHERCCPKNPNNKAMCDNCAWLKYTDETKHYVVYGSMDYPVKREYDLAIRTCPFMGKLYYKLKGDLEVMVQDDDWKKMPSEFQGCSHFLSCSKRWEIESWKYRANESRYIFSDVDITPQMAKEYFEYYGKPEEAKKYVLPDKESL